MPNGFSYVIWEETQQRSVIPNSSIQGNVVEGSELQQNGEDDYMMPPLLKLVGMNADIQLLQLILGSDKQL